MKKVLYTTSEYIDSLHLNADGNTFQCTGTDFAFFSNKGAADYDAQWLVDFYKKEGKKVKKPKIYRIKLELV